MTEHTRYSSIYQNRKQILPKERILRMNTANQDIETGNKAPKTPKKTIRTDIQILRAISIILVLLYHLEVPNVSGGFIGVDIFFVISGYLVTGSFIKELLRRYDSPPNESKSFHESISQNIYVSFLIRRIKRLILPSSVCLLLVLMGVYLSPLEIPYGRESVRYAALNYINFFLWSISGNYGGDNANKNIVMHFWSLAVEWQFYIISPLILIVVWTSCVYFCVSKRFLINAFRGSVVLFSALTFGLCFAGNSSARFYLVHTRAWEFLVGALVNMEEKEFLERITEPLGTKFGENIIDILIKLLVCVLFCALSVAGYFIPFQDGMWPGWWTLYPISLTCFVIILQRNFGKNILTIPLTYIGDWSYSIYLYHWPIILFAKVYILDTGSLVDKVFFWGTCLFLTFAAALASYYVVEKASSWIKVVDIWWIAIFAFLTILIVSLTFIPLYYPTPPIVTNTSFTLQYEITDAERKNLVKASWALAGGPNVWISNDYLKHAWDDAWRNIRTYTERNNSKCIVLIGDSHAVQFHYPWNYISETYNATLYHLIRACSRDKELCYLDVYLNPLPFPDVLKSCTSLISFIATWHYNLDNFVDWRDSITRVAKEYSKYGQVFFFKDFQYGNTPYPLDCILENGMDGKDIRVCHKTVGELTTFTPRYETIINELSNNTNFGVVDLLPYITANGTGYAYNYDYPLYFDDHHLAAPDFTTRFQKPFLEMLEKDVVFRKFVGGL